MKLKITIRSALRTLHTAFTAFARRWCRRRLARELALARGISSVFHWAAYFPGPPPPEQLDLGLDQITDTGLPLRDAIPVRSAEYWLEMGEPDLALKELQTLPESARQHPWPLRVHLNAITTN